MKNLLQKASDLGSISLLLELTRRCNACCAHCLRGNAQELDMKPYIIDSTLKALHDANIEIADVTFTGGEPSLVPHLINHFVDTATSLGVGYGSFYIATNGLEVSEDFIIAVARLHFNAYDNEVSSIKVSSDQWHQPIPQESKERLKMFKFVHFDDSPESEHYLISEGRARGWGAKDVDVFDMSGEFDLISIYVNVFGQIIEGCDFSYTAQPHHVIGHVPK